jgi:hypothetical protein
MTVKSALGRFGVNGDAHNLKKTLNSQAGSLSDGQKEKIVRMAQDFQRDYLQQKHVRGSEEGAVTDQEATEQVEMPDGFDEAAFKEMVRDLVVEAVQEARSTEQGNPGITSATKNLMDQLNAMGGGWGSNLDWLDRTNTQIQVLKKQSKGMMHTISGLREAEQAVKDTKRKLTVAAVAISDAAHGMRKAHISAKKGT